LAQPFIKVDYMSFEQNIQQWISIDNEIKLLSEKIHDLRERKSKIHENINIHVESNHLNNVTLQVNKDNIKFITTKVTNPLTFKYVEKSLGNIIKNPVQVKQIVEYLKENRDIKLVNEIKRFSNN